MNSTRPIPVIYNPTAGGGRAVRRRASLEKTALSAGVRLSWRPTKAAGHATELAREAASDGDPLLFAFGGDGTYNEVARGLLGSDTSVGFLPAGTTSVLAYEFKIPRPVGRGMLSMLEGTDRLMRVGQTDQGDIFLIMLSAGPDTLVLQRLNPLFKRLGGRVGVAAQGVLELLRPAPMPRFRLLCEGKDLECGWIIAGKARCYAGPFEATPGADPFVPNFEVVAQRSRGRRAALQFVLALARGRHIDRADVDKMISTTIRIEALDEQALHYQIDGDVGGRLPVELSLHPESLKIRLPSPDFSG